VGDFSEKAAKRELYEKRVDRDTAGKETQKGRGENGGRVLPVGSI